VYKMDFIIGTVAMALSSVLSVVFFWVLFQHVPVLNGWSFEEVLFLSGMTMTSMGIWHVFLSGPTFWSLERLIRGGSFDRFFLQPIKPLTYMVLYRFDDDGLGELMPGVAVLIYAASAIGFEWSLLNTLMMAVFILSGSLIIFSLFVSFSTISFWVVRGSAIGDVIFNILGFIRYPLNIFNPVIITLFTFFMPIAFVSYYPAQFILHKEVLPYMAYAAPIVAVITFAVAKYIWEIGLKNYTSTGS
jgi:ABC-2 type transport system permease protein